MTPHPSPNFGPRRGGARPDLIVLHYTAMESAEAALHRLCTPAAEVSAHYLIEERGEVFSLVDETMRAWHAGIGVWGDITDVNSRSIGIELANDGRSPFPDPQMVALEALLSEIMARWGIGAERVIAHSDLAPERKGDPGRRFDWRRLARQDLAIWPESFGPAVPDPAAFRDAMQRAGFAANVELDCLLGALRLRFRPWAAGPLDATDMGLARALAAKPVVDPAAAAG